LTPLYADDGRGKLYLQFEKVGAKSQDAKTGVKITINLQSRGTNANAPNFFQSFRSQLVFDLLQKRYVNIVSIHEICLSFKLCKIISLL
jgi:hypothetical protein